MDAKEVNTKEEAYTHKEAEEEVDAKEADTDKEVVGAV